MEQPEVLVAGAGPAGLSLAACLKRAGVSCQLIDELDELGGGWRCHYDRLHLHTPKSVSALPYLSFPPGTPRYPSRDQFVSYLEGYCRHFAIDPVPGAKILSGAREKNGWTVSTTKGSFSGKFLVLATGKSRSPRPFDVPGVNQFPGALLHSKEYRSGLPFRGKKVLVVGFGNSACEIAMDLYEQGAQPVMSVRSPVNIVPRELFGVPILHWSRVLSVFPPGMADRLSAPLIRLAVGDIGKTGLQKAAYGPFVQIRDQEKVPVIDIGALRYIREGKIGVTTGVSAIDGNRIVFTNAGEDRFDAIVYATGYELRLPPLTGIAPERLKDLERHSGRQQYFGRDAIYSCGFAVSGTGMLRAIAGEAKQVAAAIAQVRRS